MPESKHFPGRYYCDAVKTTGYWKGTPCGSIGLYAYGDKQYCGSHYAMALKGKDFSTVKAPRRTPDAGVSGGTYEELH